MMKRYWTMRMSALGSAILVALAAATIPMDDAYAGKELKMAASWKGGQLYDYGAKGFAEMIEKLSNGDIKVKVFPGGTLGSPLKVSEAVKGGVADMGHTSPTYEWGKDKANVWLGGFAGSLGSEAMVHWLYEGGGLELFRKFRMESAGVVDFPCGMTPSEAGLHSTRPIRSIEDFKGMRFRAAGAFAEIAAQMGASAVNISKDEVIPAMERGALDSADFSTLSINKAAGIHKVAKYLIVPGIHQPVNILNCPINVDVWNSFSDREKMLVEMAAKFVTLEMGERILIEDADALAFYKSEGVEIIKLDDDFLAYLKVAVNKWSDDNVKALGPDSWFARLRDHQRAFAAKWDDYTPWR